MDLSNYNTPGWTNVPNDNGYYVTMKEGCSFKNGDNGIYIVTHGGETKEYDMYEIGEIFGQNLTYYWYTGTEYRTLYSFKPAYYAYSEWVEQGYDSKFYYLNDVYMNIDPETQALFDDIVSIVSPLYPEETYFTEGKDNRSIYKDKFNTDVEYVLTDDGPITFTPVYSATAYDNEVGYFYWYETDDMSEEEKKVARRNAPRYVFMTHSAPNFINPETNEYNITCEGQAPGLMEMPNWVGNEQLIEQHSGHMIQGTTFHLVYFGDEYNEAGSYTFPKGLHVGFFMFAGHHIQPDNRGFGLRYSIQEMNLEGGTNYKHWWAPQADENSGYDPSLEHKDIPDIFAVTYSYKGTIVVGFEDDVDKDENDILYFVSAPITPPHEITEQKDVEMSWVVACEDLGGSYDYDFNDIVFDLGQVDVTYITTTDEAGTTTSSTSVEKSELYLRPLAAGGTRKAYIYYDGKNLGEIHDLLREGAPSNVPINVGGSWEVDPTKVKRIYLADIDLTNYNSSTTPEQYVSNVKAYVAQELEKIKIVVDNEGQKEATKVTAPREDGTNIPQMLLLPRGWDWPNEMVHIFSVYPQFKNWAENQEGNNGWITPPVGSYHTNPIK